MYPKAKYWILTIPYADFVPYQPPDIQFIRGQLERGDSGYLHWQLSIAFVRQVRLSAVKKLFGDTAHAEPTRSDAANDYVFKDETAVAGTRFELGSRCFRRNSDIDWQQVKTLAIEGRLDDVPPQVFVQNYRTLRAIRADYATADAIIREVFVYWGPTGVGKSRRAWEQAGMDAYPKDPNSKFWDGYRGQEVVVIDEFRGVINISHMLRWLDRYPVLVEIKGSSTVLAAKKIYITSNLHPRDWYPDLDELTVQALLRRLNIIECPIPLY